MSADNTIINSIRAISEQELPHGLICKTITDVDQNTMTVDCMPTDEESGMIFSVRLISNGLSKGFTLIPKKGSLVFVHILKGGVAYIAMTSDLEAVHLNGESYKGLVKIDDLITRLNNIEDAVNNLIYAFTNHTHPYVNFTAGPATTSPTTQVDNDHLTKTTIEMIENPDVKHGPKFGGH